MSVWYCIPSKRPAEQAALVLRSWRERGYQIALYCDEAPPTNLPNDICLVHPVYSGYAKSVNSLVRYVLSQDAHAEWFVTGGDDIHPDPNHSAEEIAHECSSHFYGAVECAYPPSRPAWSEIPLGMPGGSGDDAPSWKRWSTFGVMQPTGDKWGDKQGPYIERVAGSPWMGREFCRRINQGNGPLWPEYFHMGEDEELQAVATKLGVFWQREDLTQYHDHWGRARGMAEDMPRFLERANSPEEWRKYKAIFEQRQATGFPGHEPIP